MGPPLPPSSNVEEGEVLCGPSRVDGVIVRAIAARGGGTAVEIWSNAGWKPTDAYDMYEVATNPGTKDPEEAREE